MSLVQTAELKNLQTRLQRAEADLRQASDEARVAQERESALRRQRDEIMRQIKAIEDAAVTVEPVITEHALLRYIERVMGVDLAAIKEEMLGGRMREMITTLKTGSFPGGDYKLVVKNGVVITVDNFTPHRRKSRTPRTEANRHPPPPEVSVRDWMDEEDDA